MLEQLLTERHGRQSVVLPVAFSIIVILSVAAAPAGAARGTPSAGPSFDVPADSTPIATETTDVKLSSTTQEAASMMTSTSGDPIAGCTNITSSGAYHLTGNITAPADKPCLFINASNVVLDGNGYTLEGNGSGDTDGYPIIVANNSWSCLTCTPSSQITNVTIKNIRVDSWPRPIDFSKARKTLIENVVVRNSFGVTSSLAQGRGLNYFKGSSHRIVDSRLINLSYRGIDTRRSDNLTIVDVTIKNTDGQGILRDEGINTTIRNTTIVGSGSQGIVAFGDQQSDNLLIANSTIRSSAKNGIRFGGVDASRIHNNTITGNNNGIRTAGRRGGTLTIHGNAINQNRETGIILKEAERSVIRNNSVRRNGVDGIIVDQSSSNTSVQNNTVIAGVTNGDGLTINYARNVTATGNVLANYTRGSGIKLGGDYDGLRAASNVVCNNQQGVTFDAYTSGAVTIERNRIASNSQDGVRIAFNVPVEIIDIRHNIIENNGDYGINYRSGDDGVVPATDNWWSSGDGPSSPGATPLEDPFTGALANGSGDAVSENDSDAGVSNIHFDPYLTSEPSVAAECPSANEPPSVSVDDSSVTVDEGQTATNTGSYADPDDDSITLNASVGTVTKNADGSWDWSFATTDGPDQSQTVTITATDDEGATDNATFDLTVNNVAPSVTVDDSSVTVDEGQVAINNGSFVDPGNDTVSLSASVGTIKKNADGTWDWSFVTRDGPDDSQTVTITATDDDGATDDTSFDLKVENVAPSVTVDDGSVTVDEGETAINNGSFTDPGNDTVSLSASVGTINKNADGSWDWSFATTDGPDQSQTVTITATDSDGASSEISFDLTVENAAPSVSADKSNVTVTEGETATNNGTYVEPGNDTVTLSASVGTVTKNADGTWDWSYNTTGVSDQNQTVTITATDSDGASGETTFNLTINEQTLRAGEDFETDFKGCSEVWIVFNDEEQLPVDATIQVYNAVADAEETVDVTIRSEDVERIPGQYNDRPVYKFNVHDYFDRDEDGDDKILAVSAGGSTFVENPNRCADNTGDGDDNDGNGNGNDAGKNGSGNGNGNNGKGR